MASICLLDFLAALQVESATSSVFVPRVHQGHTPKSNSETLIDLSGTNAPNKAGITALPQL